MKTKLSIDFHNAASIKLLEEMALIVAQHNGGQAVIDLQVIIGYIKGWAARYNNQNLSYSHNVTNRTLVINYLQIPFITIVEKEVYTLKLDATEKDLLAQKELS